MKRRCPSAKTTSKASDDFPEPLGPVTTQTWPWGMAQVTSFRLCSRACDTAITGSIGGRADGRTSARSLFLRAEIPQRRTRPGVALGDVPPACPPPPALRRADRRPGPRSITQSHARIDVEIVLDHDHAGSLVDQVVQGLHHVGGVLRVQARAGLVDHEEGPRRLLAQRARQLESLRLAPRQRRQRLPQREVAESHLQDGIERAAQHVVARVLGVESAQRLLDAHGQDLGDVLAAVLDGQHLRLEALALAHRAEKLHVGEKLHLDRLVALARAFLAAPGRDVEREVRRGEVALRRRRLGREARAHAVPGLHVGRRVAARRASEGGLVDEHRARERSQPLQRVVQSGLVDREIPRARAAAR